jgi:alkylhydroperoxidase/carboxymuconolactone decarboxylase family protein YurZ
MGRPGLPLADREVINVVILFLDGFEPQLYSHLRGALRVGVKPRTLHSVLLLAASIASKNPRTAIQILRCIAQNPKQGSF